MSWERYDDSGTRWSLPRDEGRQLLALAGGELREYVELPGTPLSVNVYEPYPGIGEGNALVGTNPLSYARLLRTHDVVGEHAPWVRALDDREVFDWLASAGYAS